MSLEHEVGRLQAGVAGLNGRLDRLEERMDAGFSELKMMLEPYQTRLQTLELARAEDQGRRKERMILLGALQAVLAVVAGWLGVMFHGGSK